MKYALLILWCHVLRILPATILHHYNGVLVHNLCKTLPAGYCLNTMTVTEFVVFSELQNAASLEFEELALTLSLRIF